MRTIENNYKRFSDEALMAAVAGSLNGQSGVKVIAPTFERPAKAIRSALVNRFDVYREQQAKEHKEQFIPVATPKHSTHRKIKVAERR